MAADGQYRFVRSASDGGLSSEHPAEAEPPVLLAPATDDERNAVRPALFPIACWRLADIRFGFDSSLVKPEAGDEMAALALLVKQHPGAPLSVFGHADPVGKEDYNKRLSGRRSAAVYALLTRNPGLWEEIYSHPLGGDDWGAAALETMRRAVGSPPADEETNTSARSRLFLAYMDRICRDPDGNSFKLGPADFLARGEDGAGKGDYQGCSEFNPLLMFSESENREVEAPERRAERDAMNAVNRRVVVFLFRPGSRVHAGRWPCPAASEGVGRCKRRFWSDAARRRTFQTERREHEETRDTFACRFYERLAGESPCERIGQRVMIRLFDQNARPIGGAPYLVTVGDAEERGTADGEGWLSIRPPELPAACLVKWSRPPSGQGQEAAAEFEFELQVQLELDADETEAAKQRLHNLGYPFGDRLEERLAAFRRDYPSLSPDKVEPSAKAWHDNVAPPAREPRRDDRRAGEMADG